MRSLIVLLPIFMSVSVLAADLGGAAKTCQAAFLSETPIVDDGEPTLREYAASKTLSQSVRDNAPHYWATMRQRAQKYFDGELDFKGLVVGDTHIGNFILGLLKSKIRFYIADIKDSGRAPYILDFTRLVMSTQAIFRRSEERPKLPDTIDEMYAAYIEGLEGTQADPPKELEAVFESTAEQYDQFERNYVDSQTAYNKFRLKTDKVAPFSASTTQLTSREINEARAQMTANIRAVLPNAKILDYAVRPRDRGGSQKFDRFWTLINNGDGNEIIEFKEIGVPAVASYEEQQATLARYEQIMHVFWGVSDPLIQPVFLDGRLFMMRPKKIEMFTVPYKVETKEERKLVTELSVYVANYLGQLHGRQMSNQAYAALLKRDRKRIKEGIRLATKDYLEILEGRTGVPQ